MDIKGHKIINASPSICYRLLTDPEILIRTMPGLKSMEAVNEGNDQGKYNAELEVGVAAIRGHYSGTMTIEDPVENESYRLMLDGQGPGGFVVINMTVRFEQVAEGCDVIYEGEAKVGGTVAGVGQRMLSGIASFILNQFFGNVAKLVGELN